MSNRNELNRVLLDTARAISAERPSADVEHAAVARVRSRLAAAVETASTDPAAFGAAASTRPGSRAAAFESCADYQARMPALVAGTLPEAQRLLVEDHARECIPCRRQLQAVRAGQAVPAAQQGPAAPARVGRYYAAAAAVVGVAAAGAWLGQQILLPPQDGIVQVRSLDGRTFVAGAGDSALVAVAPGDAVDGGQEIRTGAGSRAVFALADGSRIEAAGLTSFRVDARRSGHRIRVDRGSVIVQAAERESGSLIVSTDEMLVAVKGTIFAVTHGVKGSRVSVIEGEVEVEQGRERHNLLAGDQLRTSPMLVALTLQEEVGWSQDADRYLALLEEFRSLRSELNQLMDAAPARHSTRLLDLMPADTTVYVAMPNASSTLSDVFELVRSRLESSELLAERWEEIESSGVMGAANDVITYLGELGDAMGEETVVALVGAGWDRPGGDQQAWPLALTEVTDAAALREALAELPQPEGEGGQNPVRVVENLDAATDSNGELLVWIADDIAAASPSLGVLRTVAANRDGAANPFVGSSLHERLAEHYAAGAELLGAVDLAAILARIEEASGAEDGEDDAAHALDVTGLGGSQDIVVSRTQDGERADVTAVLTLDGQRSGIMSWLSEPGANGALDFFSPDTSFVAAGVIEEPLLIHDQLIDWLTEHGVDVQGELAEVEAELGLSLRNDLLVHLGGEYALGVDGPVLPSPAWLAVASVYNAGALQSSFETLVSRISEELADTAAALTLEELQSGGRTVYRLALAIEDSDDADGDGGADADDDGEDESDAVLRALLETPEIFYTYFDGYMVSSSSTASIDTAIRHRSSGVSLTTSQKFLDLLPRNGYADFSAVVYNRLAETASELLDLLPAGAADSGREAVVEAIEDQLNSHGPSLYTVYAGRSEIVVTSSGPSLLAFAGLGQALGLGSLLPELDGDEEAAPAALPGDRPPSDPGVRVAVERSASRDLLQPAA